jgi:hypothetical protein
MELLPKLEKLSYFGDQDFHDEFRPFINERQAAGHPVRPYRSWSVPLVRVLIHTTSSFLAEV